MLYQISRAPGTKVVCCCAPGPNRGATLGHTRTGARQDAPRSPRKWSAGAGAAGGCGAAAGQRGCRFSHLLRQRFHQRLRCWLHAREQHLQSVRRWQVQICDRKCSMQQLLGWQTLSHCRIGCSRRLRRLYCWQVCRSRRGQRLRQLPCGQGRASPRSEVLPHL